MNQAVLSEELKKKLLREVEAAPAPTRAVESRRAAWLVGGALVLSFVAFLAYGGVRITNRPTSLMVGTTAGTATIAVLAMWMAVGRGRAMLGRANGLLVAVAIGSPVALLAWKIIWSAAYDHGLDRWPSRLGLRCLGVSLTLGALPLAAMLFSRRGTDGAHPGRAGMSIGVAFGVGVATLVDAWCPVAYVPHFLLGHILPLVILGAAGLWLGQKILAP